MTQCPPTVHGQKPDLTEHSQYVIASAVSPVSSGALGVIFAPPAPVSVSDDSTVATQAGARTATEPSASAPTTK